AGPRRAPDRLVPRLGGPGATRRRVRGVGRDREVAHSQPGAAQAPAGGGAAVAGIAAPDAAPGIGLRPPDGVWCRCAAAVRAVGGAAAGAGVTPAGTPHLSAPTGGMVFRRRHAGRVGGTAVDRSPSLSANEYPAPANGRAVLGAVDRAGDYR